MTVVPVTATVTALVLMDSPPESLGTRRRIEPLSILSLRPALLKLKIVLGASRVMVRSEKVSSEGESPPVRTPVSSATRSLTTAARAAASDGRSLTSRTIWVTRASLFDEVAATARPAQSKAARPFARIFCAAFILETPVGGSIQIDKRELKCRGENAAITHRSLANIARPNE